MYRMNNPYTSTIHNTLAEAKRAAHAGLDSIAAKRGYSMVESKRREGTRVLNYMTVYNSKGKVMTGVVIYKLTAEEIKRDGARLMNRNPRKVSAASRKRFIELAKARATVRANAARARATA